MYQNRVTDLTNKKSFLRNENARLERLIRAAGDVVRHFENNCILNGGPVVGPCGPLLGVGQHFLLEPRASLAGGLPLGGSAALSSLGGLPHTGLSLSQAVRSGACSLPAQPSTSSYSTQELAAELHRRIARAENADGKEEEKEEISESKQDDADPDD